MFHTDHMLLGSNKWEYAYYLLFNNMHGTEQYRKKNSFLRFCFNLFYFLFSENFPENFLCSHGKAELPNHNQNLRITRLVDQLAWFSLHSKSAFGCDRWFCFFQVISKVGASLLRDTKPRSEMTVSGTPLLLELNLFWNNITIRW